MVCTSTYSDSFREVVPDMFQQILDGTPQKEYRLKTGRFELFLKDERSGQFYPHLHSVGSLDNAMLASKIHQFFSDVDLSGCYCLQRKMVKRGLVCAFKQIICGKVKETHNLDEASKLVMTIYRDYQNYYIVYDFRGFADEEEKEESETRLASLVKTPNLRNYFNAPHI